MSALVKDQVTIDQLPCEMLEKVFEKLDLESIKNCCLVNQKWNNVISQSLSLMEKMPLHLRLSSSWSYVLKNTIDFNRKYHTIIIDEATVWNKVALKVLSKHGSESRLVRLIDCEFGNKTWKTFNKIIGKFKNVEKMTFDSCEITGALKERKHIKLPCLKSVVMSQSCFEILNLLQPSQLQSIKINTCEDFENGNGVTNFMTFLGTQHKLEELAIVNMNLPSNIFNLSNVSKIQMPLKRLSLKFFESDDKVTFLALLSQFTGTLEEIELKGPYDDSVYEMIFKQFRKLKVVQISANHLPKTDEFYQNLRRNNSVLKLIVSGSVSDNQNSLEGFIGHLPNIEELVLIGDHGVIPREFMLFVSNNLHRLNNLHVHGGFVSIRGSMFNRVQFPGIKKLSFCEIDNLPVNEWKQIANALPNIETMSVEQVDESLNSRIFKILTKKWKNLTHLKLGFGFVAVKQIFNQLLRNCEKIQTVEIADSLGSKKAEILRDFKKQGLRFIIHANEDINKIFYEGKNGLWANEDVYEDDNDFVVDEHELAVHLLINEFLFNYSDEESDVEDDENYLYFDSDGEPQNWLEDYDDYNF